MSYVPDFPAAETAMRSTLASREFEEAGRLLRSGGVSDEQLAAIVDTTATAGLPEPEWARLEEIACAGGVEDPLLLPRHVLLTAALRNLVRVRRYAVVEEVKGRLLDFFVYVCDPDRETEQILNARRHGFVAMCRMITLRRFPGGQVDWELGGVPRSWLRAVPRRDLPRMAWAVAKAGGFRPFYVMHTSYRRELPIITDEAERHAMKLLAESLGMQPQVRGTVAMSWMLDPDLHRVSPHLKWIAAWNEENRRFGAFFSSIGPAPEDSGFLVGDRRRRRAYESGDWRPVTGIRIWSRKEILRWLRERG
jgi:hypothetical protein